MNCRICGREQVSNKKYEVTDRMFGGQELFKYQICPDCGTLQICKIPENIGDFYPSNYYSFKSVVSLKAKVMERLRDQLMMVGFPKILVNYFEEKIPNLALAAFLKLTPSKTWHILDVGCGEGKFLKSLHHLGFHHILGIEPFATETREKPFKILKKKLEDFTTSNVFDLISFNHVFEHVEQPAETLLQCHKLLKNGGKLMIRVPVKDSFAFEKYGKNWVQWDAPRHFQLLTKKAFDVLAKKTGFEIEDYYGDSYKFQFTGSEKYDRGLPYQTSNGIFSKAELDDFKKKSKQLNQEGRGDQVVVILKKIKI